MSAMRPLAVVLLLAGAYVGEGAAAEPETAPPETQNDPRETVLDRKVHIEEGILEVPQVPRLCDSLKMEKRRINVGDCELHCEVEGQGMPLVLINGGPGGTHHDFHPHFARAKESAKVVYYDQRGCGLSDYKKGPGYSIDQAADDLDKLREALKFERWAVLGWSYGGLLAQCYVVKYPERVAGLVLVGSSPDAMRLKLKPTRQYDYLSPEEQKKMSQVLREKNLPLPQKLFNAHLNGDWKRQNYYRPSKEALARMALYGWVHDPEFRNSIGQQCQSVDLRGAFEKCPFPIAILDGRWDLTWNTDKSEKMHACFPGSKLVMFEKSSHGPFAEEPEKFFKVLGEFVAALPEKNGAEIARWKEHLAARRAALENAPDTIVQRHVRSPKGWGAEASEELAKKYGDDWPDRLTDTTAFLRTGFALYECKRYEDALKVFEKWFEKNADDTGTQAVALVWQGHMLDLLGRRDQAVEQYKKALGGGISQVGTRHDQYGIVINRKWVEDRIKNPFARMENKQR